MCEELNQMASRAALDPFIHMKSYQIQTSTFRTQEPDQMAAGGVNQRRPSQNTPPAAALTAALSFFLAPALEYAKRLPVQRRSSSDHSRNRIIKSSGSFSCFCCRGA